MEELIPEPKFNDAVLSEVSRFIETAISDGALAAVLELNENDPPLGRDERDVIILTASSILVQRLKNGDKIGEAENFAKLAISKLQQRGHHVLRIANI